MDCLRDGCDVFVCKPDDGDFDFDEFLFLLLVHVVIWHGLLNVVDVVDNSY